MTTLSTIRSHVKSRLAENSMITDAQINTIIQSEHTSLLEDYPWSQRKQDTVITISATYGTGTLSTSGTAVTGASTVWSTAFVGRYLRVGSNTFFHRITARTSDTAITIESALPSDAAALSTYTIFRHRYNLPSNFGRVLNVTSDNRLSEWTRADIDRIDPYRTSTATRPDVYTIHGLDPDTTTSQIFQIEFWPVPSSAQAIRVEYSRTNTLTADTDEPLYRGSILVWKAAETCAYFLHARTGDNAWMTLAERWHARYAEDLQGAREDDAGRASMATHVRDTSYGGDHGTDYWISRDPLGLR
mgnify:CR=1 FL=1